MAKNQPGVRIEGIEEVSKDPFDNTETAKVILGDLIKGYGINRVDDDMYKTLTNEAKRLGYDLLTGSDRFNSDGKGGPYPYWMSNDEYNSYLDIVKSALDGDQDASMWLDSTKRKLPKGLTDIVNEMGYEEDDPAVQHLLRD